MKKGFNFRKHFFPIMYAFFLIIACTFCNSCFAVNSDNIALQNGVILKKSDNFFDLFSIAETFLNPDAQSKSQPQNDVQQTRLHFFDATQKFNQGNVAVAYNDYLNLISGRVNDFELLNFSKFLYKNGLFSLAELAVSKIKYQDKLKNEIKDLKKSFENNYPLDKNEEIYLAKALSSIYYDNSALEMTYDLNKKSTLMQKSDYANYVMAQAFYELKQYNQALNYIKNAISINSTNVSYSFYKAKILTANKNYAQALKIVERNDLHTLNFQYDFLALKHNILSQMTSDQSEKKYYSALSAYYDANYYKTINAARAAISLNKKNYNALNLLAKSQLKIGEVDSAAYNFNLSNSIKKSNTHALIGLGDCEFISENFVQANNYYKKAYSKDAKNQELNLKLVLVSEILNDKKSVAKFENSLSTGKQVLYFENFEIATTLLNNVTIAPETANMKIASRHVSNNLKIEYLKAALFENPFFTNAWLELSNSGINSQKVNDGFIRIATFSGDFDYFYYYNLALIEYAQKNYMKTIEYLNTSSGLNPQFEPANQLLLNLKIK